MKPRTKIIIGTYVYLVLFVVTAAFAAWAIGRAYDHMYDTNHGPAHTSGQARTR